MEGYEIPSREDIPPDIEDCETEDRETEIIVFPPIGNYFLITGAPAGTTQDTCISDHVHPSATYCAPETGPPRPSPDVPEVPSEGVTVPSASNFRPLHPRDGLGKNIARLSIR